MTGRAIQWRPFALASGEDPTHWAGALSGDWRKDARLVKGKGDGSDVEVWFAEVAGRPVVIKLWPLKSLKRRVQAHFRATPACRHWKGAAWLLERELPTAEPLALLRSMGPSRSEALVMQRLPGRTLLEWMADGSATVRAQHDLARVVGRSVARLLSVGFNRDHKPSNLIVIESRSGPIDIAIIDCVAIHPGPAILEEDAELELAMLLIEALGCGVAPRMTLRMRALESYLGLRTELSGSSSDLPRLRRNLWRGVGETIEAHGDPTPRVNPLKRSRE